MPNVFLQNWKGPVSYSYLGRQRREPGIHIHLRRTNLFTQLSRLTLSHGCPGRRDFLAVAFAAGRWINLHYARIPSYRIVGVFEEVRLKVVLGAFYPLFATIDSTHPTVQQMCPVRCEATGNGSNRSTCRVHTTIGGFPYPHTLPHLPSRLHKTRTGI